MLTLIHDLEIYLVALGLELWKKICSSFWHDPSPRENFVSKKSFKMHVVNNILNTNDFNHENIVSKAQVRVWPKSNPKVKKLTKSYPKPTIDGALTW
jgi:hypothetical protein